MFMKKINILYVFITLAFVFPGLSLASSLEVTSINTKASYTYPMINFIISARISSDTQIVFWNSNQPVRSSLWLSKEGTVTNENSVKYSDGQIGENHFVVLRGLESKTNYYYVVGVSDNINKAFSETKSFFTK